MKANDFIKEIDAVDQDAIDALKKQMDPADDDEAGMDKGFKKEPMDGEEFAGGTYFIGDAGEIVNAATSNDVYGHIDDSEAELVKKIKKGKFAKYRATESVEIINEALKSSKLRNLIQIKQVGCKSPGFRYKNLWKSFGIWIPNPGFLHRNPGFLRFWAQRPWISAQKPWMSSISY